MNHCPLATVIVNNYNYARFLGEAIDSALSQTYPNVEVIVVDDGSTDSSREIIAGYGDRITPILKPNGGQTSTFNASFQMSRGDVIIFVDSDDALRPAAVEQAMKAFEDPAVVKVHWPLLELDAQSCETGKVWCEDLPEGDLRDRVLSRGPDCAHHPPTTGNAFARGFLEKVFPMPEVEKKFNLRHASADMILSGLAALCGRIARLPQPQGYYRVHGDNGYSSLSFDDRLNRDVLTYDHLCSVVAEYCRLHGMTADVERWPGNSWTHNLRRAVQDIGTLVPAGEAFILVDEDQWKSDPVLAGRTRIPFLEHAGQYWGNPSDDAIAIRELERLRKSGAAFIVFAWSCFWWLDHYSSFRQYLDEEFACTRRDERLIVFDLRKK